MDSDSGQGTNPPTPAHLTGARAKSGAAGWGYRWGVQWVYSWWWLGEAAPFWNASLPSLEIDNLTCSHHQVGPNNQSSDFKYHMTKYQNFCQQVKISNALIMLDGFPLNRFRNFLLGNKSWYFTLCCLSWTTTRNCFTWIVWPNKIHTMRRESL